MIYYISEKSELNGNGTREKPFKKITQAANIAVAGDTIVIGDGVYREWINPKNGGTSDNRITYINDENAKPVISGAEIIDGWKKQSDKVWCAEVSNEIFGSYNPYTDFIFGDWYNKLKQEHHTGEVFFNGEAMYEVLKSDELQSCKRMSWYVEVKEKTTVFYCNFRYRCWTDEDSKRTDITLGDTKNLLPVTMKNNVYFNSTRPYKKEESPVISKFKAKISVSEKSGHYYLNTNLGDVLDSLPLGDIVTTNILGKAFEPDQKFENRDGTPIKVNTDIFDNPRGDKVKAGAFEKIESKTRII